MMWAVHTRRRPRKRRRRKRYYYFPPRPGRPVCPEKSRENCTALTKSSSKAQNALPSRNAAKELHCQERTPARCWTGKSIEKIRTLVGKYCEESYRVISLRSQKQK